MINKQRTSIREEGEMRNFIVSFQDRVWVFPALALIALIIGQICAEKCAFIRGDILGFDLDILGIFFYSILLLSLIFYKKIYRKDWLIKAITVIVSVGVGVELILIKFQVQNNIYCPKCLISGFFFLILFFIVARYIKTWVVILLILFGAIFTSFTFSGSVIPSYAKEIQYPSFGNENSKTEITVYSDYFCPACRKADEQINSELRKIKDKVKVRFVDVPLHPGSPGYAEVFLYTWLESGNNIEKAIRVRDILFNAAGNKIDKSGVLKILNSEGIPFKVDSEKAREIFRNFYNPLMKMDKINEIPAMVITKGNNRKPYVGIAEILKALAEIK
jgi:uncharacterized membrane protein